MDKEFLSQLRSGREEAFGRFVEAFRDRVVSTCFRFLRNREDAEETALDVFLEVHRSLASFREEADLSTWVFRIAVTKSLDRLRKIKRKKRFDAAGGHPAPALESVAAPAEAGPEQLLENRIRAEALQKAIDGLPENQRVAVTLSRVEGLEAREIAAVLGTSVPAVDALVHRAKTNLRKKLARHYRKASNKESENGS